jgi:hypothetical protein
MKRTVKAILLGSTVFGATVAAAASIGLESASLGAGDTVVAACADDIGVEYDTSYSDAVKGYAIDAVRLTDVPVSCNGLDLAITLVGEDDAVLRETTGTVSITENVHTQALDEAVSAEDLGHVAVVISG